MPSAFGKGYFVVEAKIVRAPAVDAASTVPLKHHSPESSGNVPRPGSSRSHLPRSAGTEAPSNDAHEKSGGVANEVSQKLEAIAEERHPPCRWLYLLSQ